MGLLDCGLKSARFYCDRYPGLCCKRCTDRVGCERVCWNDPSRCGYATQPTTRSRRPAQKK